MDRSRKTHKSIGGRQSWPGAGVGRRRRLVVLDMIVSGRRGGKCLEYLVAFSECNGDGLQLRHQYQRGIKTSLGSYGIQDSTCGVVGIQSRVLWH